MDRKQIQAQVKVNDDTIQMVVLSDASEDRMGDTIDPSGWELGNFVKNPVLLWAHDASLDASIPAIGKVENLHVDAKGKLVGAMKFDMDDPFAAKVANKYKKGFLNAVSVGFKPLEYTETNKGYNFLKQELLELSCVNVPANQNALVQLRSLDGKHNKTAAKLMKEYLESHEPNKQNKEVKEDNPMQERLNGVVTEMQNVTATLQQIVSQMTDTSKAFSKAAEVIVSKEANAQQLAKKLENPSNETARALEQFTDVLKLNDKHAELLLKLIKQLRNAA